MAAPSKPKVIQVQKPAQSLQAFQKKVAAEAEVHTGYLKPLLIGAGVVVAAAAAFFAFRGLRADSLEKHQIALADLQLEVTGDVAGGPAAVPPDLEQRMRDKLPQLSALVKSAPRGDRALTQGLLSTWQLELGEKAAEPPVAGDPLSRLRLAQRQIALGQGADAAASLAPLRAAAGPDRAWASLFWNTLLDLDRLQGDRTQAWKDLADYKSRFKQDADPRLEQMLAGV
jgi:hypothetical protein